MHVVTEMYATLRKYILKCIIPNPSLQGHQLKTGQWFLSISNVLLAINTKGGAYICSEREHCHRSGCAGEGCCPQSYLTAPPNIFGFSFSEILFCLPSCVKLQRICIEQYLCCSLGFVSDKSLSNSLVLKSVLAAAVSEVWGLFG